MGIYREKRNTQLCKPKTSQFCYVEAYRCYIWLAGFSGEMIIYVSLLEFSSPSYQKEWKITWSYSSQTQAAKLTCLVVHRDAHLSYKRYKVYKLCFKCHPRYTSTNIHNTHCFCIFLIFQFLLLFLWKKKCKTENNQNKNMKENTQSIKLDWLKSIKKKKYMQEQKREEVT